LASQIVYRIGAHQGARKIGPEVAGMSILFGLIQIQRRNTWQTLSCTWN
jgi:hypothetical protein